MKSLPYFLFITILIFSTPAFSLVDELVEKADYVLNSTQPHQMRIINSGTGSLYARIDMIRRAKTSIELETFIYTPDTAGRLILKELVAAAKRGVKVRMLVDKNSFNFELNESYADELRKYNVDLRYYNAASNANLGTVQYRNHRKLLIVDDKEVITGGRNVADEYFDLSTKLNFLDRDTTIKGDIAQGIRRTFDKYWNADMVQTPAPTLMPKFDTTKSTSAKASYYNQSQNARLDKIQKAKDEVEKALGPNAEDDNVLRYVLDVGKKNFQKNDEHICPDITFSTDREGGGLDAHMSEDYKKKYRYLSSTIIKWINTKSTKELTIDTPYFLRNDINLYVDTSIERLGVKVNVFTNSLASTDAVHVASVFNDTINNFTPNENFNAYTYKGKFSGETALYSDDVKNATWGTHSKSMVFDDESFMVGTFNMDNRSLNFNNELGVFCTGSKELTADVKNNIKFRMKKAYHLNAEGNPDDCSSILKDVSVPKRTLYYLLKIPSNLMEDLL